jgi:DNA-binding NarL/FixJ family response regulator
MRRSVVIVDDHALFRRSARRLLELEGYDVVGEAADAAQAAAIVEALEPDVVLLDVVLPDGSGLDLVAPFIARGAQVVLVSSRESGDLGDRVRRSRAAAFIPKDRLSGELLNAVLRQSPDDRDPTTM